MRSNRLLTAYEGKMKLIGLLVLVIGFSWGFAKIYYGLTNNDDLQAVNGLLTMLGTICVWVGIVIFSSQSDPRIGERAKVTGFVWKGWSSHHKAILEAEGKRPGEESVQVFYVPLNNLPNGNQTLKGERLCYSASGKWYPNKNPTE